MKNLTTIMAGALLGVFFFSCSVEPLEQSIIDQANLEENVNQEIAACVDADPEARIVNNGSVAIDLDIFDENGNLLGFVHNLLPSETSVWISFPEGNNILFAVSNDVVEDEKVIYDMSTCTIFDMEFTSSNQLSNATPQGI